MTKRLRLIEQKIFIVALVLTSCTAMAQNEAQVTVEADLVSSYVWRGVYQTGISVQPGLTLSYNGLSLGAWGSTDFSTAAKEFDLSLGFESGGFGISVTDYWWAGEGNPYGHYTDAHFLEGSVTYSFGEALPLSLSWSTMLGLDGDRDEDGKQCYSTYIDAGYGFNINNVSFTAGIGLTPWTGLYHKAGSGGFDIASISLRAAKELKVTESFTLPVFVEAIVAPNQDNVFLLFGISL
ncbi:MAG: hypothetical protein LBJ39_06175 [Tannerellaceae bacterium]|jgi:hypothetical protein|nr:hypothetical protein [Tannerellaceae bacterium]